MQKWILIILIIGFLIPYTTATIQIEVSLDNTTWRNITNINENGRQAVEVSLNESTLYYFRGTNDTANFTYFNQQTKTSGEIPLSSIAIIGFVTLLSLGVLFLPKMLKRFSDNEILNHALTGGCIVIGLFLLSLVSAMVATVSDTFKVGVTQEVFRFMYILNWTAYLTMCFIILLYGKKMLDTWKLNKEQERMGEDDY